MTLNPYVSPPPKTFDRMTLAERAVFLRLVRVFLAKCTAFQAVIRQQGLAGDAAEEYVIGLYNEGYLRIFVFPDRVNPRELAMRVQLYDDQAKRFRLMRFAE